MRSLQFKLQILIIALSLLTACSSPTPAPTAIPTDTPQPTQTFTASPTLTPTNTATATPVPTNTTAPTSTATPVPQPGDVLLSDNFDSIDDNHWSTWLELDTKGGIEDGMFLMHITDRNTLYSSSPSGPSLAKRLQDVDISIDVQLAAGEKANSSMGVQCRKRDNNNYYYFAISGSGLYNISKLVNGQWHQLITWAASSAIRTNRLANQMRVICSGDLLQLWVNNVRLATLHDQQFTQGVIGLVAGTFDDLTADTTVVFDNLVVVLPEPTEPLAGNVRATSDGSTSGTGLQATSVPQATAAPAATASGNGQLIIIMCQNLETSVTIFKDGQIVKQESLHRAGTNVYDLPAGHYDVQFNTEGYYNLNTSYDIVPGGQFVQYIGDTTC